MLPLPQAFLWHCHCCCCLLLLLLLLLLTPGDLLLCVATAAVAAAAAVAASAAAAPAAAADNVVMMMVLCCWWRLQRCCGTLPAAVFTALTCYVDQLVCAVAAAAATALQPPPMPTLLPLLLLLPTMQTRLKLKLNCCKHWPELFALPSWCCDAACEIGPDCCCLALLLHGHARQGQQCPIPLTNETFTRCYANHDCKIHHQVACHFRVCGVTGSSAARGRHISMTPPYTVRPTKGSSCSSWA